MPNYQISFIYKICCMDLTIQDIYIGSTINFRSRKRQHKECCNNEKSSHYNMKIYNFIRENGGWDNWNMIQIKELSCNSKLELHAEERKTYEELKPTLNTQKPNRNQKEWDKEHKWKRLIPISCECGCKITKSHMERHKKTKKHLKLLGQNH